MFGGTLGPDVIVGTEGNDIIEATPGDKVCSRGGNDDIAPWVDGNASVRTKIDTGRGNDEIYAEAGTYTPGDTDFEYNGTLTTGNILEIHTGPGDDRVGSSQGNDQIFTDGGADNVDCGAGKYDVLHRIPGEAVTKTGCEKTVDATAYSTFAKFKPSYGSWSLLCPGQPSKSATWYVSSTSYGATNPCDGPLVFAFGPIDGSGAQWTAIHVTPGTKFVVQGQGVAKEGFVRNITFQDWQCGGETSYVTHASGPMTVFDCYNS